MAARKVGTGPAPALATAGSAPTVVPLEAPSALDPAVTGEKAAHLARALGAGLPVLPGLVLTTADGPASSADRLAALGAEVAGQPWGDGVLVVRSSSTAEDTGTSSMAGRFRSVLGVRGPEELDVAARAVLASAARVPGVEARPMAVLVQPQLDAECGGVLFGVHPVTGQRDRIVVEAVAGGPEALVSGQATAQRWVLTRRGRVREVDGRPPRARGRTRRPLLDQRRLRALAELSARAAREFGGPQDVEWAWDGDGRLWLLQSRPVTAVATGPLPTGPVLGPGPVAETFPAPLRPLEQELWLGPLRDGVARAIGWTGAIDGRRLAGSPIVTAVGGWPAVDLELFGYVPSQRSRWRWIDPRPGARRVRAAWRLGRLRAELPARVHDLLTRVDDWLATVPALSAGTEAELLELLAAARAELVELHAHEVAAATLRGAAPGSLAALALHDLGLARSAGLDDAHAVSRYPVLLALTPPRLGHPHPLPPLAPGAVLAAHRSPPGSRELVRLRARWVQELGARVVDELARRLAAAGRLPGDTQVALLALDDLAAASRGQPAAALPAARDWAPGPPLPTEFRLTADGGVVSAGRRGARPAGGTGAGGGRGIGTVTALRPEGLPAAGSVLVVRTLDPVLAAALPGLAGLVAETGSTLSHLAILAREAHVPTVVAVHDAVHRFPPGTRLLVDGGTGEVTALLPDEGDDDP